MASKGHFLGQIPHPMHSRSEMKAILEEASTSIHSLPVRTTGHDFLHSCLHFLGLHLSELTMAILVTLNQCVACASRCSSSPTHRVNLSDILAAVLADGRNLVVGGSARQCQESGDALGCRGGESRVPVVQQARDVETQCS
ncbi:hypothetical protein DOTSEDRAFT_119979 [Dothistroma septosporum NZE10]|uniref:Uncharacterized protein n=1 Tax=Dothistroma septosporum (strain NZE10 / CBS 128990) TaxID=675120 RepID=N1Q4C4_DOTSN|nr:hypothetical protein DOTSEDRAFT_119979 [Dothistroma septosporum NZE10]